MGRICASVIWFRNTAFSNSYSRLIMNWGGSVAEVAADEKELAMQLAVI